MGINQIFPRSDCNGYRLQHPASLPDGLLMLAEGLNIFRVAVPPSYVGKSLAESEIRTQTGCNVIAIRVPGAMCINPGPSDRFSEHNELILIGSRKAESRFFQKHSEMRKIKAH